MKQESPGDCCDECGRQVEKFWRNHFGYRYCSACYNRLFKKRQCPRCGKFSRLPETNREAYCFNCQKKHPCIRCERTGFKIGKQTVYGPVCNACSTYFRQAKPCEGCGRLSRILTRVSRFNNTLKLCVRCARSDHQSCQACGKHRLLEPSEDGRMLCKKCLKEGYILCPICKQSMPAGSGRQCDHCYWKNLLKKRILIDCAAFSETKMQVYFRDFGKWLEDKTGPKSAATKINKYLPFFLEIEKQWLCIPDYSKLVEHFSAEGLRCYMSSVKWMNTMGYISIDGTIKKNDSDNRRIEKMLNRFENDSEEGKLLKAYHKALVNKLETGKTTPRSIRLALRPAVDLLEYGRKTEVFPPTQKTLEKYLKQKSGQRAAVSGFVGFIRDRFDISISLPKINRRSLQQKRRRKMEKEILTLLEKRGDNSVSTQQWLKTALAYFHDLPKKICNNVEEKDVVDSDDQGMTVLLDNRKYWVPFYDKQSD